MSAHDYSWGPFDPWPHRKVTIDGEVIALAEVAAIEALGAVRVVFADGSERMFADRDGSVFAELLDAKAQSTQSGPAIRVGPTRPRKEVPE
jgi:hypothetical protein